MSETNTAAVAAEMKGRRAPQGADQDQRTKWREQKRKARERARGGASQAPEPTEVRPPYEPNPASIALCAKLGSVLWSLSCMVTKHRALTDEEAHELGAALDPLFYKYLPAVNQFAEELNAVGTVWQLWEATKPDETATDRADDVRSDEGVTRGDRSTPSGAEVLDELGPDDV